MSENPYQPSQVAQIDSGQSLGLRRIVAIAAAQRAHLLNRRYYGFRLHALLWQLLPIALWIVIFMALLPWWFAENEVNFWLMQATGVPLFIFAIISSISGGVTLSPRVIGATPEQDAVIRDGVLYASGVFTRFESYTYINGTLRMLNCLMNGRGQAQIFVRIPCQLKQPSEQNKFGLYCGSEPLRQVEEIDVEDVTEYWYAAGKLDPQHEPEFVYQHLGFYSEPAVKIHYIDEQQRPSWLVLSSPDERYLSSTLAVIMQSSMIASDA
jgi:hypothetical protein